MKNISTRKGMNPALAAMTVRHKENQLISAAAKANMLISLMVLHDKFGFGQKKVGTVHERVSQAT